MSRNNRIGDWFQTYTGRKFYPLDARPEDIEIEDIAHALAYICRFGGHCHRFYSVAQHSVMVSNICTQAKMQALMHDATEAYLGDMVRPLKLQMPDYRAAEDRLWIVIADKFGMAREFHPEVKPADNVALMTERRDLLLVTGYKWSLEDKYPPLKEHITPLPSRAAFELFLKTFCLLGGKL